MFDIEKVRKLMEKDRYAAETTGAVIESIDDDGRVTVRLDINEGHFNSAGRVMGGAIYTIADYAFASTVYANECYSTAINCSMEYLSAGRGSYLTARGYLDKAGRNVIFGGADVFDETGRMIARMSVQSFRMDVPQV